jgi:hypothetical protein
VRLKELGCVSCAVIDAFDVVLMCFVGCACFNPQMALGGVKVHLDALECAGIHWISESRCASYVFRSSEVLECACKPLHALECVCM